MCVVSIGVYYVAVYSVANKKKKMLYQNILRDSQIT